VISNGWWDEERLIKWMAVGMVLGLLAMAVMPLAVGDLVSVGNVIGVLVQTGYLGQEWGWLSIGLGAVAIPLGFWNPWVGAGISVVSL